MLVLILLALLGNPKEVSAQTQPVRSDTIPEPLPGTVPLTWDLSSRDMSRKMLEGAHTFIERKIEQTAAARSKSWQRDFKSTVAYEKSVDPNRERLMDIIGVQAPAVGGSMEKFSATGDQEVVAETARYKVYQVRWPVVGGIYGEGLLVQPKSQPVANVIALPDADQTPEQLLGLAPGVAGESQFARRLAENGYQVLVPVLISRTPRILAPNNEQTNREWIYRQAFHMGKHIIGYEVQKVMAAVDWFRKTSPALKTGVAGYCEGGLIAMYAAAVDKRIDAALVSGYFGPREKAWDEPIYRNVWSLLAEFGDAEIVSLMAPRPIVVEYSAIDPELTRTTEKRSSTDEYSYTGYKGAIRTPEYAAVNNEFRRIGDLLKQGFQKRELVAAKGNKPTAFGSADAIDQFGTLLTGAKKVHSLSGELPKDTRRSFDVAGRQQSQVQQLEDHIQQLVRYSDAERYNFYLYKVMPEFGNRKWSTRRYHQYFSPEKFIEESANYRKYYATEILGRFNDPLLPFNARTRKLYDEPLWTGYEVVLDVHQDLIAPGILLLPKDLQPGEKRPVVVCQHGRNGVPQILVEGNTSYYDMAAKLADQGFIVYAPYGMFSGEDKYRWLSRKANTVKGSLFSFILSQHDQLLKWLGTLPYVDKNRIAFYGKSYGGETAMRVPSVLEGYSLSICSADFGDWTRKVADTNFKNSFMHSIEWEMPYFRMGSTFSYAEMAYLIFPRPFMVERGRHDLVQPDEFVAYEYAKVSFLYDQFNLLDRTEIEFFNGGHASRNEGAFEFLHKHLDWP